MKRMIRMKHKELKIGLLILSFYFFWALYWPFYSFFSKGEGKRFVWPSGQIEFELIPPFRDHFFLGTDVYGRSLGEVLSAGLCYSLGFSFCVTFFSAFLGTFVGYLIAKGVPKLSQLFETLTNLIFVIPNLIIAIFVLSFLEESLLALGLTLILTGWAGYARVVRGEVKRILGLPFIEGAKALGIGEIRLFWFYIFPSILPQIIIHMVLGISGVIMSEAILGYLGLGGSEFSWGAQFASAKNVLLEAPYLVVVLSLVMGGLILGLNLVGDSLRDLYDPLLKGEKN